MAEMHEIQDFGKVDRAEWEKIKAVLNANQKFQDAGISVTGDSGVLEAMGIKVSYSYDESAQEVKIQTLHTPFFISEAVVDQKIHDAVESAL